MKIQKDCNCCGAVYAVVFTQVEQDDKIIDSFDVDEGIIEPLDRDVEPLYCPFCGVHESEDAPTEFDEEVE